MAYKDVMMLTDEEVRPATRFLKRVFNFYFEYTCTLTFVFLVLGRCITAIANVRTLELLHKFMLKMGLSLQR